MLVIVPHNHRYWLEKGGRWEFFWISMSGQEAVRIHRTIQAQAGPVLRLRSDTIERIAECSLRLIDGEGRDAGRRFGNRLRRGRRALRRCIRVAERCNQSTTTTPSCAASLTMCSPISTSRLPVSHLAEVSGFSRAHFSRMFTASKGVPPGEFVLQERMRRAARLLSSHSLLSVKEIANLTGFRRAELFRQGLPSLLRHQSDRVPDDRDVFDRQPHPPG